MAKSDLILTIVMWSASCLGLVFAIYLNIKAIKLRRNKGVKSNPQIRASILNLSESFTDVSEVIYSVKKVKHVTHAEKFSVSFGKEIKESSYSSDVIGCM